MDSLASRLSIFFFLSGLAVAAGAQNVDSAATVITVDGVSEEDLWTTALEFSDFKVVQPLSLAQPAYKSRALVASTSEGIAVYFESSYPEGVPAVGAPRIRDTAVLQSDYVQVILDLDHSGHRAYEFTVSMAGTQRDGTYSNENKVNYDWDGAWESAVRKTESGWSAEILIPWTIAPMSQREGVRKVGIRLSRGVEARGEIVAIPHTSQDQPRFLSSLSPIELEDHRRRTLDVYWHASATRDLVADSSTYRAGLDLFWKSRRSLQLAATLRPDFSQIESDDLVVNFDAVETYYAEKRPFFTENHAIYDVRTPRNDRLIYTRRMGGPKDDGEGTADIDAAAKLSGSAAGVDFGAFAVIEDSESDRDFYALRALRPSRAGTIGYLGTYSINDREKTSSTVHALDLKWRPNDLHSLSALGVTSDNNSSSGQGRGYGHAFGWEFAPSTKFNTEFTYTQYDRTLDFNTMGYLKRNSLRQAYATTTFRAVAPARGDEAGQRVTTRSIVASYQENADGIRLDPFVYLKQTIATQDGARIHAELRFIGSAYDDLMSRGNGLVRKPNRTEYWAYYSKPFDGKWKYTVGIWAFEEGLEGKHAVQFEPELSFQPTEQLSLSLNAFPRWSQDWLTWRNGRRVASFRRNQADVGLNASWIPNSRHELRLKAQWIAVNARDGVSYRIADHGAVIREDDAVSDFQVRTFSAQLRYRYVIDSQREIYLVYGRGGYERNDASYGQSTASLLWGSSSLRDDEQLLAKIRWRL